jgi:peroxiredoxin Q/BCP
VDFTNLKGDFEDLDAIILGISPDSIESHKKFKDKHSLKITLLSDTDKSVLRLYGVWQLKKMAGREYHGVVRSTFLIDPKGVVRVVWRKVSVKGHAQNVLARLKELQN